MRSVVRGEISLFGVGLLGAGVPLDGDLGDVAEVANDEWSGVAGVSSGMVGKMVVQVRAPEYRQCLAVRAPEGGTVRLLWPYPAGEFAFDGGTPDEPIFLETFEFVASSTTGQRIVTDGLAVITDRVPTDSTLDTDIGCSYIFYEGELESDYLVYPQGT